MRTEARFLVAVVLMLAVLVGTNRLFPPVVPEETVLAEDSVSAEVAGNTPGSTGAPGNPDGASDVIRTPVQAGTEERASAGAVPEGQVPVAPAVEVEVRGPLYRFTFSSAGARMLSGELLNFEALNRGGPVELVPEGAGGYFGQKLVLGADTVDLTNAPFRVEPEGGLVLTAGGRDESLRFIYEHPTNGLALELEYSFSPETYQVAVTGGIRGVDRALLVTDLGAGLAYAESDSVLEGRAMAYVSHSLGDGIRSTLLAKAEPPAVVEGPLLWAAFRSKFFVIALLAGDSDAATETGPYLGGLLVRGSDLEERVRIGTAQSISAGEPLHYRLFLGPQEYARLSSLGQGMEEVNPYGWRLFRPIVRPIVSVIMTIFVYLHTQFNMGYGWVLVTFGVLMRVVLFPLNHKAMKAQLKNMAAQPLVKEIQERHKDNPEKLQKEMMGLYKEHGFNPLAGCLPMLLPWPVLIALFFVFQNTIELRGVSFLWLPDLSAKDPLFILPIILALSMFLMQWVSLRSLDQENPQMKMMMYIMPPMMLFIFLNLASGLNLYYATANIATLPQQIWIARERQKMKGQPPLTLSRE